MRIEILIDGGFLAAVPGLAKPIVLDGATLSPAERIECEKLIEAAQATSMPRVPGKSIPDGRRYQIRIDSENAVSTLAAADPSVPPAYSRLIEFVTAHGKR